MNKISVIVPVYKVEPYLHKCVDSIINQDYENLEIILVDDGSPDNCPAICDEYARMDKRVKVVHKVNGGLSDARNAGLDAASGDYVFFVDSDDWIEKGTIKECTQLLNNGQTDIVITMLYNIISGTDINVSQNGARTADMVMKPEEALVEIICRYNRWSA